MDETTVWRNKVRLREAFRRRMRAWRLRRTLRTLSALFGTGARLENASSLDLLESDIGYTIYLHMPHHG